MPDISSLHPMIVHFPIALIIVGLLSDLAGLITKKEFFNKMGFYLLLTGTVGLVFSYYSGNAAGEGIEESGILKSAIENHEHAAQLSMILTIGTAIFRLLIVAFKKYSGALKYIAAVLFLVSVISIARTGYYGGELVYKHAAGVQISIDSVNNSNDNNSTADLDDTNGD